MNINIYIKEASKYPLLSGDEEKEHTTKMTKAFDYLVDEMLKLPATWQAIYKLWSDTLRQGKASNKLAEEYGNTNFNAAKLTETVDYNIEQAMQIYWKVVHGRYHENSLTLVPNYFKAAGLSKEIYIILADTLIAGSLSDENKEILITAKEKFELHKAKLVCSNLRLVVNFAQKFSGLGIPLDDLIQEGNIGLIRAAEKFDPSKNFKFSTYAAWWIKQAFIKSIRKNSKIIRLPAHIHNIISKVKKLEGMTIEEMAEEVGTSTQLLEKLQTLKNNPVSLDAPVRSEGQNTMLKDFLPDDSLDDPTETLFEDKRLLDINIALGQSLTSAEADIINWRYGLNGNETHTLEQIAEKMNITREWVRKIEAKALDKLKKTKELKEYV